MQLIHRLCDHFSDQAARVRVTSVTVGLRYTAVTTGDGGIGIAYTDTGEGHCCGSGKGYRNFEGRPAVELLACLEDDAPLQRSMALALVNALNHARAGDFPEDATDGAWMDALGIGQGSHVAMVGFFRPLMKKFKERGAIIEVLDAGQGIGDCSEFYRRLESWAEALLLTSTSILNGSTEEVLGRLTHGVKAVLLGPSTPMVPEAFTHLPVCLLAGTVPVDQEAVLRAVRHGQGTPVIHRFSRKVLVAVEGT